MIETITPAATSTSSTTTGSTPTDSRGATPPGSVPTIAATLTPMFDALLGEPEVEFEFWDGSRLGRPDGPGRLRVNSPDALRRIVWSPDELGFARAFICGDIDVFGDPVEVLRALQASMPGTIRAGARAVPKVLAAAHALGAIGMTPPPAPPEEMATRRTIRLGRRHSIGRDKGTVSHHYDVGNDFYELVLGPAMTYSCARFTEPGVSLTDAQTAKHDLVCRKLGLHEPGDDRHRLLDVGCGWGSMAMHAAATYGAEVVGVTISDEQATRARERVLAAGLGDRVEIRIQDYREVTDGPFDAISSIGMAEHVGHERMAEYFERLHALLRPGGRLLNHAISSVGGSRLRRRSFVYRYVFPDGELLDVGDTVLAMERAGFEVRDVENLREHYATTLRHWVANLQERWDEAVALVGERRARAWLLYMAGSVNGFDDAGLQLHQTLGVRLAPGGASAMPATRHAWG